MKGGRYVGEENSRINAEIDLLQGTVDLLCFAIVQCATEWSPLPGTVVKDRHCKSLPTWDTCIAEAR